jgi:hypothetical protein
MPLGGGAEPGVPDCGNGEPVLAVRLKWRAGVGAGLTPDIALPTASWVSLGLPVSENLDQSNSSNR